MRRSLGAVLASAALLSAAPALAQSDSNPFERPMRGESAMHGLELDRAIAAADAHPLGSSANPVRVSQPTGERAYLARLRCSNGTAPRFQRRGNVGSGVFGNIVDLYDLRCAVGEPAMSAVYMDMYHPAHDEQRSLPGFTFAVTKGPPVLPVPAPPPPTTPSQTRVKDPSG